MVKDCQKYTLAINAPPIEGAAALTVGSQTGNNNTTVVDTVLPDVVSQQDQNRRQKTNVSNFFIKLENYYNVSCQYLT